MKSNAILALILLILGAGAYWYEFKQKPKNEESQSNKSKLISVPDDFNIEYVELVSAAKGVKYKLKCEQGCKAADFTSQWSVESPIFAKVDEGNISTFLRSLFSIKAEREIDLENEFEAKAASYGLDRQTRDLKKIVLKIKEESSPRIIYFGDKTPVEDLVFVWTNWNKTKSVQVVASHAMSPLDRNLTYWRKKRIFDFSSNQIQGFQLMNEKGETNLAKENGLWKIEKTVEADSESVDTFLTGLVFLAAADFASDDRAKDAAKLKINKKPSSKLVLSLSDGKKISFSIYKVLSQEKTPKIYGVIDGVNLVYELDRAGSDRFDRGTDSFRSRLLINPKQKEALSEMKLEFLSDKKTIEFKKLNNVWSSESKLESSIADILISKLFSLRIQEFEVKNQKSLEKVLNLTLSINGTAKKIQILLDRKKTIYYAKVDNESILELEKISVKGIPFSFEELSKLSSQKL